MEIPFSRRVCQQFAIACSLKYRLEMDIFFIIISELHCKPFFFFSIVFYLLYSIH